MTLLMYLKVADVGGETNFPLVPLKLAPGAGDAVLFFNVQADGTYEQLAQHAGMPVLSGRKQIATKWVHCRDFPPLAQRV
jgi:hypothetical protein